MITVVLVRTHSPGNLGASARAAANFGARLLFVDPRCDPAHPDALAFASGAEETLESAERAESVEAVAGRHDVAVALTSLRGRRGLALPPRVPPAALRRSAANGSVALVFGPERGGLRTEEVLAASARWSLPTEPSFPTLNLSQAVAVALALLRAPRPAGETSGESASAAPSARRRLESEIRRVAESAFPERRGRPDPVDELVALLRRARPDARETQLLLASIAKLAR